MYLKRIEIQGFKSFAEKTIIEFKEDVTAIVGPNGSGKSNISDAIRWVLGEQSIKSLRGSKMEDVIFSGTTSRRPLGFADVTIVLDNSDYIIPIEYKEVAISRRIFRSGESEYTINNNPCRLKDIRALIMDTGIGKEGYSIVGQGRIDEILSDKPEDRRNIFDEAAGIVRFKTKKEEAEKKLNNTKDNLVRIRDLISEINNQYDKLENDAGKAIEFTVIYDELKELEVSMSVQELNKLNLQINENLVHIENVMNQSNNHCKEKVDLTDKLEIIKTKLDHVEKELENTKTKKYNMNIDYNQFKSEVTVIEEKVKFLNKDIERLGIEEMKLKEDLKNYTFEIEELLAAIDETKYQYIDYKNSYNKEKLNLDCLNKLVDDTSIDIDRTENKVNFLNNQIQEKKNEIKLLNSNLERIKEANFKLDNETIKVFQRIENNNHTLVSLDSSAKKLQLSLADLDLKINQQKVEHKKLLDKKISINEIIKSTEIKLSGLYSNYKLYQNMENNYEGFFNSVKNLLRVINDGDKFHGFIGTVADLIKVDSAYEKAISIALGANLQYIVVKHENNAQEMIQYLKEKDLGRVTFLPMNVIKGRNLNIDFKQYKDYGILGLGHQIVDYDKKYEEIFVYLLGRIIIVDNLKNALRLAKKFSYSFKIVTLDGDLINSGGSLTGGSIHDNNMNIISRKNKINAIRKDIEKYKNQLKELESSGVKLEISIEEIGEKLSELSLLFKDKEVKLINKVNEREVLSKGIDNLNEIMSDMNLEIKGNKIKEKDIKEGQLEKEKELNKLLGDIKSQKLLLDKLHNELKEHNIAKEKAYINTTDSKVNVNVFENKLQNLRYRHSKLQKNDLEIRNSININTKEIKACQDEIIKSGAKKEDIFIRIEKMQDDIKVIEKALAELHQIRDILIDDEIKTNELINEIDNKINTNERENNKRDLKNSKLKLDYEYIVVKLKESYDLDFQDALLVSKEIKDTKITKSRINELKLKIKALGNVNLSAVEEFKNIKERLNFLNRQYDDLQLSKENLKNIIYDIEVKMRNIFSKSLQEINENFSEIFAKLFNGGKASLYINDGEDILKSGIEIEVQPPGKRLQNINLLSGGEKSLTAVAILFAIIKAKPSPFCILDEIDAALDEANISRYTDYLKEFKENTQFILITHRKTTMEIANVLYGVTMENEGISKLVAIKLKDYLDDVAS